MLLKAIIRVSTLNYIRIEIIIRINWWQMLIKRTVHFYRDFLVFPLRDWYAAHVSKTWREIHFILIFFSIGVIFFKDKFKCIIIMTLSILKIEWCGATIRIIMWPFIICWETNFKIRLSFFFFVKSFSKYLRFLHKYLWYKKMKSKYKILFPIDFIQLIADSNNKNRIMLSLKLNELLNIDCHLLEFFRMFDLSWNW